MSQTSKTLRNYLQMDDDYPKVLGGRLRAGWTGPWPPPEKLLLIEMLIDPIPRFVHHDQSEDGRAALVEGLKRGWKVHVLERVSASQISDEDFADMTHVMRGAEYHVVGDWTP